MASLETNMDFVKELLNSKSINNEQRNTILDLLKIEINNELKISQSNINVLKKLSIIENVSDVIYHYPKETVNLLNKFSQDTTLKYTTHIWDIDSESGKENVDRENFISNIGIEFKDYKFKEILFKNGQNDFYWTIHNFLFEEYKGWNTNVWGEHKLKFGWNNKCLQEFYLSNTKVQPSAFEIPSSFLPKEYTDDFWDKVKLSKQKDEASRKLAFPLKEKNTTPIELFDEDIIGDRKINGRFLKYFEDYINLFKNEIEFRGNSLLYLVEDEFSKLNKLEYDVEIKGLKGTIIYTSTSRIKQAIEIIVSNLKARTEKQKSIQIIGNYLEEDGCFELSIIDKGSHSEAFLSNKKIGLNGMGQMKSIRDNLRGLCDFSIISNFKNEKGELDSYEIKYLSIQRPEFKKEDLQFVAKKTAVAEGFTYKMKFYE